MQMSVKEKLSETVLSWPGTALGPHRFGGVEFSLAGKEIAHLHGERHLDIPFSKSEREELVAAGRARPHHIFPDSGWVTVYIDSEADLANAVGLLRMRYEKLASGRK